MAGDFREASDSVSLALGRFANRGKRARPPPPTDLAGEEFVCG
jgi:hypothetical protein